MGTASHMIANNKLHNALTLIESKLNCLVIEIHDTARAIEDLDQMPNEKAHSLRKIADSLSDLVKLIKNEKN
jgi:hypothetical protein